MRTFVLVFVTAAIGCAHVGDDDDLVGATPDASTTTRPPDASGTTPPPAADAAQIAPPPPPPGSGGLGARCNEALPCDLGFDCMGTNPAAVDGFCAQICFDDTDCIFDYTGPGTPGCFLAGDFDNYCGIACGPDLGATGPCPTNLSCQDLDLNGIMDLCGN